MTEQEIINGNKLIAEFMGHVPCRLFNENSYIKSEWLERHNNNDTWDLPYGVRPYLSMPIQYNTSWDWLMPVVEKIEAIPNIIFDIHREATKVKVYVADIQEWATTKWDQESKITHVYNAVIEFINYYNQTIK